jgi:threonine/homoserine/homoserine lactone efflux protein
MSWSKYGEFLAFAVVLIVIPGPDFAVVTKNTLVGGRRRGRWTALGISSSNLVQGTAAAFGLSALIAGLHSARRLLMRRKVRRGLDATTGAVLLGFSARLATEHV